MCPGKRSTAVNYLAIFIMLYGLVCLQAGDVLGAHKITVPSGAFSTRLPCWCYDDNESGGVQYVTWEMTKHTADDDNGRVILFKIDHPGNMTYPKVMTSKFALGQELSLLINRTHVGDSGTYLCHVMYNLDRIASSSVNLLVTDESQSSPDTQVHHYIIPVVVVAIVLLETAFIFAMWLNLRTRTRESTTISYIGFMSPGDADRFGERLVPDTPPWKTENQKGNHTLLVDDLNDGMFSDKDSGFGEKISALPAPDDVDESEPLSGSDVI